MSEALYIQHGEKLIRVELDAYSCENDFQILLASHPDLLAGDQIDPFNPRQWLLVAREAAILSEEGGNDRWSLDLLFIDQEAIPTLVEVKRKSDTRLRREVVGQMMDYAANSVTYWADQTLKDQFYQTAEEYGNDPEATLNAFLQEHSNQQSDEEDFWKEANENLRNGKVRLVFVADRIPPELQRTVEFLNERMRPTEVLALELRRYSGGAFSTHIPRILGQTSAAQMIKREGKISKLASRRFWNETSFFENASARLTPTQVASLHKVLEFCKSNCFDKIDWGTGSVYGSFNPKISAISKRAPITVWSGGRLDLKLGWLEDSDTACTFRDLLRNHIKNASLPLQYEHEGILHISIFDWEQWIDRLLAAICSAAQETLDSARK